MNDQTRNLNPTAEARVAMIIWGDEYSKQKGGSMDFWDGLSLDRQKRCELVVALLKQSSTDKVVVAARLDEINHLIPNFDGIGTIGYEYADGSCVALEVRQDQLDGSLTTLLAEMEGE